MSDTAVAALAATLNRLRVSTALTDSQADEIAREFATQYAELVDGASPETSTRSSVLSEVGGYIGAIFVVAGAVALVTPNWDHLSEYFRVGVLAGPGLLLVICGLFVAATTPGGWAVRSVEPAGPRRRLVSVLALAAGPLFAGAADVVAGDNANQVFPLVLLAVWGCGYLLGRGVVLHLGTGVALSWSILALSNPSFEVSGRVTGAVLILAGVVWATLAFFDLITETDLAIAMAGIMAFIGAELIVVDDLNALGDLLLTALAALGLGGYLRMRRLSALAVGAVSLAVVAPQALIHYTGDSLGASGALLVCGLSIVAASALSLRLRNSVAVPAARGE